ncbi:MAG: Ig-like domain-containing protein, partial [Caldilinea sp.]
MISASSTAPSLTNVSPIPVLVVFSETVTGFDASDVAVTNGSVSGFSGSGTTYNFSVNPGADGLVSINIPAGAATDVAGNATTTAAQLARTYDGNGPT